MPIQTYLPEFPVYPHPIPVTARLLASHLAGIRHYDKALKEFYNTTNFATVNDAVEVIPLIYSNNKFNRLLGNKTF